MKTFVIILAGGSGSRMKSDINKILIPICGRTVIRRSVEAFLPYADHLTIVCRPDDQDSIVSEIQSCNMTENVSFVLGGQTRQASVLNGLLSISPEKEDIVLIHDAARCLVDNALIERVIVSVKNNGSGIPGIPVSSTCKIADGNAFVVETPVRSSLFEIQTPQGFTAGIITSYSMRAADEHIDCTDDASVLEHYHIPVKIIAGSSRNIKLTEPDDLIRAKIFLEGEGVSVRIGMGYDVHRLVSGRKLILCGVEIPFEMGLLGHSDADVALHALMDAMLGACALGDIGSYFPDSDDRYKDISSVLLLKETKKIIGKAGYILNNADITIVAQKPRLLPYISGMIDVISSTLDVDKNQISVKATTTEKLGFAGRMEGISAYAVCSVTSHQ